MLLNLLSNAVKFTDFGSVTFSVEAVKNGEIADRLSTKIRFQVKDTGIGVASEKLAAIFLPFEQAGKRDRNSEGTGLGLAISQQIVQMMGGTIHVNSILGKGSTFWFEVDLPTAADWLSQPATADQKAIAYQGKRRTILVIDDRPENRAVAIGMLEPLGFKLAEADDGQTACRDFLFLIFLRNSSMFIETTAPIGTILVVDDNPLNIQVLFDVLSESGYRVAIAIADNGIGISEEIRSQLFDPFFTTKPIGKGTGLGLSISHQIITQKHGGKIDCDSTLGQGTEFVVQIPVRQAMCQIA